MLQRITVVLPLFLLLLSFGAHAHVWSQEWLNPKGCIKANLTNSGLQCPSNATVWDLYGVCSTSEVSCTSNPAQQDLYQNPTNTLPEYLLSIYDASCNTSETPSFLGHIMVMYSPRQLLVLGWIHLRTQFYDCHQREWLNISSFSTQTPMQIQSATIDLNPNPGVIYAGDTPLAVNRSHPYQFSGVNTILVSNTSLSKPLVLANYTLPAYMNITALAEQRNVLALFTANLVFYAWSPSKNNYTSTSRVITAGSAPIPCDSALVQNQSQCLQQSKQIRGFLVPPPSQIDGAAPLWKLKPSPDVWQVGYPEVCQQLHAYPQTLNFAVQSNTWTGRMRATPAQAVSCPNPMSGVITFDRNAVVFNQIFAYILPPIVFAPINLTSSPIPPTPSPLAVASPPSVVVAAEEGSNMQIIIISVVVIVIVVAIVAQGVGCYYIRRKCQTRLKRDAEGGMIYSTRASCAYTFCCINIQNYLLGSYLDEEYAMHSGDEEEQSKILTKTPRDIEFENPSLDALATDLESEELTFSTRASAPVKSDEAEKLTKND